MKRAVFILTFSLYALKLGAQTRTCLLQEVNVVENCIPARPLPPDSLPDLGPLQLMNSVPGIIWRSNGASGSSGISIQGAAPAHTEIHWNGIPFGNAFLAQADASLLSGSMLRNASLRRGGTVENGFCSSFGGSLQLGRNKSGEDDGLEIGSAIGSFGQLQQWADFSAGSGRTKGSLSFWNQTGLWDYSFDYNGFRTKLRHSARHFYGMESNISVSLSKKHTLESGVWLQHSEREIPAVLFEEFPAGRQADANKRMFLRHRFQQKTTEFIHMLGISSDILHYEDEKSRIDNHSQVQGLYYQAAIARQYRRILLSISGHMSRQEGRQSLMAKSYGLNRTGAGISTEIPLHQNRLLLKTAIRQEIWHFPGTGRTDHGVLPSVTFFWKQSEHHSLEAGIHHKMRSPGLNDLYWPGAGNPLLRTEKGYNAQADWKFTKRLVEGLIMRLHTGCYFTKISNYILWQPAGIWWQPENAGTAVLRGLNLRPELELQTPSGFISSMEGEIRFSRQILAEGQESLRLPFVPDFQTFFKISAGKKGLNAYLKYTQTGTRSTGLRSSGELNGFYLFDCGFECRIPLENYAFSLRAEGGNLLNASYRLVPAWPMPGRNFSIALSLQL